MIQNIKIDAIYYLTNSDFEMEFNLCGCCKMRLLNDKAEDVSSLIKLLARAVSRSQVILCCGKLFEEDGLINVTSKAIKKPLTTIDNSVYGIADNNEIQIPETAVPLVNSDGCFCGCILESGPQSIILLTDNKSLRKTVMKPLIHPYIEELILILHQSPKEDNASENEITEEQAAEETALAEEITAEEATEENLTSAEEITLEETEEPEASSNDIEVSEEEPEAVQTEAVEEIEETAEKTESVATENEEINEATAEEENIEKPSKDEAENSKAAENKEEDTSDITEIIMETKEEIKKEKSNPFEEISDINNGFGLYLEPERVKFSKKSHYALDYTPSKLDETFISRDEDAEFEYKDNKFSLPILIIIVVLLIALAILAYALIFLPMRSGYTFSEYVRHIFSVSVNNTHFL